VSGYIEVAPSKLNLSLRVVGRRADGYHLLETLFAFVDSGDELSWNPEGELRLSISGPFAHAAPLDETNLVLRAAKLLDPLGKFGGALHLTKNVPSGAGLGGGSADAAAALRLLNRVWELGYTLEQLAEAGAKLGADVPVCVHSRVAWARGVGDELSFVAETQSLPVLVICPPIMLATATVFSARPAVFSPKSTSWPPYSLQTLISGIDKKVWPNDLCPAAISCEPKLARVYTVLHRMCLDEPDVIGFGMSGSGSSHFIVCNSLDSLRRLEMMWLQVYPVDILLRKRLTLPTVI
jgi:4-diphosphocytidyl-2-C-methyl-D-erythritol kinase